MGILFSSAGPLDVYYLPVQAKQGEDPVMFISPKVANEQTARGSCRAGSSRFTQVNGLAILGRTWGACRS